MTLYTYQYGITSSFPNQIYSESSLYSEVQNSIISIDLHSIDSDFVFVYFNFKATLSPVEQTTLDTIVSTHTGAELSQITTVNQGISGSIPWNIRILDTQITQSIEGTITVAPQTGSVFTVTGNVFQNNFPLTQSVLLVSGSSAISQGNPLWVTGSIFQTNQAIGTQTIAGTVTATQGNASATQNWRVFVSGSNFLSGGLVTYITGSNFTQSVSVSNPVTSLAISNLPGTQTIAPQTGSVFTVTGNINAVTVFPATQSIEGIVSVSNFPSTQTVSVSNPTTVIQGTAGLNPWLITGSILALPTGIQQVNGTITVAPQTGSVFTVTGNVGAITVFPSTQSIQIVSSLITQSIQGGVSVSNFPSTQTVSVSNPITTVSISNLPGTQTISPQTGSVFAITGTVGTTINFPATQSVAGIVSVSNFPSTQTVSVSNPTTVIQGLPGLSPWLVTGSILALPTGIQQVNGTITVAPQTGSVFTVTGNVGTIVNFPATQNVQIVSSLVTQSIYGQVFGAISITGSVPVSNFPAVQTITGNVVFTNPKVIVDQGVSGSIPWLTKEYESPTYVLIAPDVSIGNNKSMVSLDNNSTNKIIRIKTIKLVNSQDASITGIITEFRFYRMTSHSGGTLLTPQTLDTIDTIDAGITCRTGAAITGESGSWIYKKQWSTDEWKPGTLDQEGLDHAMQTLIPMYTHAVGAKPLTLRPGEGLTIKNVINSTAGTFDFEITFTEDIN